MNIFPNHKFSNNPLYQITLKYLSSSRDSVKFLQIGAFDGKHYDELYEIIKDDTKFKGLLIEPLKNAFDELLKTYSHRKDWLFENVAITEKKEIRQIWTIPYELKNDPNLPEWAVGCSTLLRNSNSLFGKHCNREEFEALKKHTVIEFVQCDHLLSVLEKHNFFNIDIVQVDTEGYDWLIIKQLNLEENRPKIINFEFFNLTPEHYGEIITHLNMYDYSLYKFSNNIVSFQKEFVQELNSLKDEQISALLKDFEMNK